MKKYILLFFFVALMLPKPLVGQNAQKSQLDYEIEIKKLEEQAVRFMNNHKVDEYTAIVKKIGLMKEKFCIDYPNKACLNEVEISKLWDQHFQFYKDKKYDEARAIVKKIGLMQEKQCMDNPNKACLYKIEIRKLEEQKDQFIKDKKIDEAKAIVKKIGLMKERMYCINDPDMTTCLIRRADLLSGEANRSGPEQGVTIHGRIPTSHYPVEAAEMVLKEALKISEKTHGKDHPDIVEILDKQIKLYVKTGRFAEVEPLLKRSLEIREKNSGKNHLELVSSLENLATFYKLFNRYTEGSALYERILKISEKAQNSDQIDVALFLNDLAYCYIHTGRYAEAESLLNRSLEIREKNLGKSHLKLISSLANLAFIYDSTGRFAEAEAMHKRLLEILQKKNKEAPYPGVYDKDVLDCLKGLARSYYKSCRYDEAELLLNKILTIYEQGSFAPIVAADNLRSLAILYATTGRHEESHQTFLRSELFMEQMKNIVLEHSEYSEGQTISFMNLNTPDTFFSHTIMYMNTGKTAITDTFNRWMQWKGSFLERQSRYETTFAHSNQPYIIENFKLLKQIRNEIMNLRLFKHNRMEEDEYRTELWKLEKKKKELEVKLLRESRFSELIKEARKVTASNLAALLHQDAVYIDFAKTAIYDFQNKKFGTPHYLLFVLGEKESVSLVDLGATEKIDQHISAYLKEINKVKEQKLPNRLKLDREAKYLYDLIIKPIESLVNTKKHLLISPDGKLNLLPFEALVTPSGEYLLEKYQISYVSAGRDVLDFSGSDFAGGTSLIMADPDYDMGLQDVEKVKKSMGVKTERVRGEVCHSARGLRFTRLPETKDEANAIDSILKNVFNQKVRNYQNSQAIEEMLYPSTSPKVLHIATHGYFFETEQLDNIENPMLRSGIVLSGVNSALKEGKDDGMVSGEKILGLPLKGTELVVLSACETGVGDVQRGEGVFGLKRAFILSGAKSLVMSLWSVPSTETTELMKEFYTLLSQGKTKAEALRQAKLSIMKNKPNPVYWGAFVLTGSP